MITNRNELTDSTGSYDKETELTPHQKRILALIQAGSFNELVTFVEEGNYSLKDQTTAVIFLPVHCAAWYGHFDIIKWLIDEKNCHSNTAEFFPDSEWFINITPLCLAMKAGHVEMVKRIITETNYDFDIININELIDTATDAGNLEFLKWLIASYNIELKDGWISIRGITHHLLSIAVSKNHLALVKWLVDEQNLPLKVYRYKREYDDSFLNWVLSLGHIEIAQWLYDEKGFKLNDKLILNKITHRAISQSHLHVLKWLNQNHLKFCPDALLYAIKKNKYQICKWLGNQGLQLNPINLDNAFAYVCVNGSLEIAKWLVDEYSFNPILTDKENENPLLLACLNGSTEIVKWLIEEIKCSLSIEDKQGRGVIIKTIISGNLKLLKYFVDEQGCSLEVKSNSNGTRPIHYAAYHDHLNILEWLVDEKKCSLEDITDKGDNIITMCFPSSTNIDILNWLINVKSICTNKNIRNILFDYCNNTKKYYPRCLTQYVINQMLLNSEDLTELEKWINILDNKLTKDDVDWMINDRNAVYKDVILQFQNTHPHFYQAMLKHFSEINRHSTYHVELLLQDNHLDKAIESLYTLINDTIVSVKVKIDAKIILSEILLQGVVDINEEGSPLNGSDFLLIEENSIRKRALQAYYLLNDLDTPESLRIKVRLHNILSDNFKTTLLNCSYKTWLPKSILYYHHYVNYKKNESEIKATENQQIAFYSINCGQIFQSTQNANTCEARHEMEQMPSINL